MNEEASNFPASGTSSEHSGVLDAGRAKKLLSKSALGTTDRRLSPAICIKAECFLERTTAEVELAPAGAETLTMRTDGSRQHADNKTRPR